MPRFVVRVGYDWVISCYRDVEVDGADDTAARDKAIAISESDEDFWAQSHDCDGEAGPTEVFEVRKLS